MPEFTGERVVPGLVDADLFNEHFARYQFASRLSGGRRLLDAGCGTGYGSAEMAIGAASVTAVDFSEEAITFARENFQADNLSYETGDCLALPDGPFDLVVAFEVIEHLQQWRSFLAEAKRVLAPEGLFLVSTPNKLYYSESRGPSGENPFHVHEFEYAEFQAELQAVFPHVSILLQNHVEGVAFSRQESLTYASKVDERDSDPEAAHFFVAICSNDPVPAFENFVWLPGTGNILREREHHIALLTGEVALKTQWLNKSKSELEDRNREYEDLLQMVRTLNAQVEERNTWAMEARAEAERRGARILELQEEMFQAQANFTQVAAAYQAKVTELEEVNRAKTEWALETERRLTEDLTACFATLTERSDELTRCATLLDRAEHTVIERTLWAQGLQRDLTETTERLMALRAANWVKVGGKLKLIPEQK